MKIKPVLQVPTTLFQDLCHEARRQPALTLSWALPPVLVPTLRLTQDPSETRTKLFLRDFITYSLGTVIFFLTMAATEHLTRPLIRQAGKRYFWAEMAGLGLNILYSGIGALKLSSWLDQRFGQRLDTLINGLPIRGLNRQPGLKGQAANAAEGLSTGIIASPVFQQRGLAETQYSMPLRAKTPMSQ